MKIFKNQIHKKHTIKSYHDAIEFIDYMILCLESGNNIQQSFFISSMNLSSGHFQNDCFNVIKFYELGYSFGQALISTINSNLSSVAKEVFENLSITLKFGSKISKTLTQFSAQLRLNMTSRLEELAHEAPIKMIFPLVILIFPIIFILLGTQTFLDFIHSISM